ncbi:leukotriene B4 receptor 1-like [Conger conger]|uniref:leukotriene B4 receptor 1-like n=1 Tax=Conger conger TaxID=82655 RepID=UPI002A5A1CB8|nr:leukotriene B4 receptor 1-like [Conger conger]
MYHLNTSDSNSTFSWNFDSVVSSCVLGLCCLVGIPGNIAVIMRVLHNYKKVNFTLQLMLNLAISDLLSLLTLPVSIYSLLHGWNFGRVLCKLFSYTVYCCLYTNVLMVTLMSVHRYLAVLYEQLWARLQRTGEWMLLLSIWVLACLLASPNIFTRDIVDKKKLLRCQKSRISDGVKVAILFMETLLGFVVPFSILVTTYFCLHKKVNQTAFFSNQRMTRLVTSIVVTFFILWFPAHVINLLDIITTLLRESQPSVYEKLKTFRRAGGDIAKTLTFINSCVNPFLYAFALRPRSRNS